MTQTFTLGPARTLVTFVGFNSIDEVRFDSNGGTNAGLKGGSDHVTLDDITLVFDGPAPAHKIRVDIPMGAMSIKQMIANGVSDGNGGTILKYQGGQLDLQGIAPQDVKADWFI